MYSNEEGEARSLNLICPDLISGVLALGPVIFLSIHISFFGCLGPGLSQ